MTALLYAARDGRLEIARMLVAAKANVNQMEANGISPLHRWRSPTTTSMSRGCCWITART